MRKEHRKDNVRPESKSNTLAILDSIRKAGHSKVTVATQTGVEEAKDWVEENQK